MPLTYSSVQTVEPAVTAKTMRNVGINIRLPLTGDEMVTFYYVSLDAAGNQVDAKPLHIKVSALQTKYSSDFATVYAILKRVAYQEATDSSSYPTGTVS